MAIAIKMPQIRSFWMSSCEYLSSHFLLADGRGTPTHACTRAHTHTPSGKPSKFTGSLTDWGGDADSLTGHVAWMMEESFAAVK